MEAVECFNESLRTGLSSTELKDAATITELVVATARDHQLENVSNKRKETPEIKNLRALRKNSTNKLERDSISKQLLKALAHQRRARRDAKMEGIIQKGGGKREIQQLEQAPKKRHKIAKIVDGNGNIVTQPADVANVFADFYEKLYRADAPKCQPTASQARAQLNAVSDEEVRGLLKKMKKGKTCAEDGLVAEMLKTDCEELVIAIAAVLTDILRGCVECPDTWRRSKLIVLFKKGDRALPKNYRPIAIIPVLAKLYSMLILSRIERQIDQGLPVEQAGFRRGMGCADHNHTVRMVAEKSKEWGQTVWAASLDLEKAFDKVFLDAVIESLTSSGVNQGYVEAVAGMYANLSLYVELDSATPSRDVKVDRGVRQGDPLSPVLFINVLRQVMAKVIPKWQEKKFGITLGEKYQNDTLLCYLSFADDTTLFAKSKRALKQMLDDIDRELAVVGLKLNADKCKVQCSVGAHGSKHASSLQVGELEFPIVSAWEGFLLLGTRFTLEGGTSREVQKRIGIAWGKFHQIWHLLRHRSASLRQRLRLFNAVVGRSLLWGAESWTLTMAEKRKIRGMQRSMLRRFAGPRRQPDEDFVVWIRRATRAAIEAATSAGVNCWVIDHLKAKWCWAGHLARMGDYRENSWAYKATFWRDSAWKSEYVAGPLYSMRPLRSRAGRWGRWEDELVQGFQQFGDGAWHAHAGDKKSWNDMAPAFAASRFK